ncbi:hypothetical protein [Entomospira culicis]|uniref:Uncharacterized protein n=1 Tax=Entomospira culicis TaxID=2719989 RepID=A0A968GDT0_9SPIO|nr:hypothetical protein [Entomospira culicis]NIZ18540.1 hypothetical protein [Entomospira culicis]NIZ68756.1 hypothetical protein [Entomospira culicis]WDI37352.1 hypothetical protein PVA46_00765 [Entomospira culicis]WDI38981.1 hypothetical protein PVA47_00775 [Entomospira culicis]
MQASNYFLSKVKQAHKHQREDATFDVEASIADYFVRIVGLPEPMARELYDAHATSPEQLACVIDFFHNELEKSAHEQLSDGQWQEIVEMIDRYAKRHEIDHLQELMQYLLDIGQL